MTLNLSVILRLFLQHNFLNTSFLLRSILIDSTLVGTKHLVLTNNWIKIHFYLVIWDLFPIPRIVLCFPCNLLLTVDHLHQLPYRDHQRVTLCLNVLRPHQYPEGQGHKEGHQHHCHCSEEAALYFTIAWCLTSWAEISKHDAETGQDWPAPVISLSHLLSAVTPLSLIMMGPHWPLKPLPPPGSRYQWKVVCFQQSHILTDILRSNDLYNVARVSVWLCVLVSTILHQG